MGILVGTLHLLRVLLTSLALANIAPPTARPAPQSLRRLFHDESSTDPDPFQSFAHQQPTTPQSSNGSASVEQAGRFPTPEQDAMEVFDENAYGFDASTIRQQRLGKTGAAPLSIFTGAHPMQSSMSSAASGSTFRPEASQAPTPIGRSDGMPAIPSPRQIRPKMSLDTLSSVPTTKSNPTGEPRDKGPGRRPGGSVGEGLRGFQFPLVTKGGHLPAVSASAPARPSPPPLHRMHSAAPTVPVPADSPSRQLPLAQASLPLPSRPPMMRQASVAVMEGRAQSQAQAQAIALAQVRESPLILSKNLLVPIHPLGARRPSITNLNIGSGAAVMMRSRSGSRVDAEGLSGGIGLRDLLKVPPLSLTFSMSAY